MRQVGAEHPKFYHSLMAVAQPEGDKARLPQETFQALCRDYFGPSAVGNLIHEVVAPIARVMGLEDCSDCAERQLRLNATLGSVAKS